MKKHYNIPVFIPHLGCPYDCVYCNQKKISGFSNPLSPSDLHSYIRQQLSYIPANAEGIEIAFFGGNFTGIDRFLQLNYLKAGQEFIDGTKITGIRISTRPDAINAEILQYLQHYQVHTIELGVQSLVDEVLEASARYYTAAEVIKTCNQIKNAGFALGLQLMLGLPGDNWEELRLTAQRVIDIRPDFTRIYPTLVLKDTTLAKFYDAGEYIPLGLEQAIAMAKEMWLDFSAHNITVIRLGLHAGEELCNTNSILAGPFHPAFGELVRQYVFREQVDLGLQEWDDKYIDPILYIRSHPRELSAVIGQHRSNIYYWQKKYNYTQIKVYSDPDLAQGDIGLRINGPQISPLFLFSRLDFIRQRTPWRNHC